MSTLRTNALEGVDAKNSMTIVAGAGNVTTTNVQEGLCKGWINYKGTSTNAVRDSLNNSSVTDNGTGDYQFNHTNNFNNAVYSGSSDVAETGANGSISWFASADDITTSDYEILAGLVSDTSGGITARDTAKNDVNFFGDLA